MFGRIQYTGTLTPTHLNICFVWYDSSCFEWSSINFPQDNKWTNSNRVLEFSSWTRRGGITTTFDFDRHDGSHPSERFRGTVLGSRSGYSTAHSTTGSASFTFSNVQVLRVYRWYDVFTSPCPPCTGVAAVTASAAAAEWQMSCCRRHRTPVIV